MREDASRVEVVGVSIDPAGSRDRTEAFLDEAGVDFRILLDPGERVVRSFRTIGAPESFLIDGEGVLRRRSPQIARESRASSTAEAK